MTTKDAKDAQKPASAIDAGLIRELAELLTQTSLSEIEVEQAGLRIRVARQISAAVYAPAPVAAPAPATPAAPEAPAAKPAGLAAGTVTSPMVGTAYIAPSPGSAPFVKVGDVVKEGATLLIVEAMKTMNPITAPRGGTVTEILVRDAEPVEFGQPLIVVA